MPPRGRAGFFCQSGALGTAILEKVNNRGLGPLDVRQRRQPRRRVGQRPPAVLGGGRLDRGRAALPRVDRQPAQVHPHRPAGLAAQADHRGALRPHHPGRPDGPRGPQDRGAAAGRRRDVPAGRGDPGRHPRGHVRRRPAGRPPAAAARPPGRDRRQLRRARAARGRRRGRGRAGGQPVRSRSAPTPTGPDFEDALDDAIDDPEVDAVVAVYIPPHRRVRRARSPTCWPPWGSSPTSRWSRRSSAPRASPSCCGCPTSPARPQAAARCRRTPRSRPRSGRSPASSSTPCGCAPRTARRVGPGGDRPRRGQGARARGCSSDHPDGTELDAGDADRRCWRRTTSTLWEARPVTSLQRGDRRPAGSSAGTSCSRPPPTGSASGPTSRTCGATSTGPAEMRDAWESLGRADRRLRDGRLRRPEERAAGRTARASAAWRTRCSGRSSRSASPARSPSCSTDRVLPDPAARSARRGLDDPRDQGRADAVRLPRHRGRRRRRRWRS